MVVVFPLLPVIPINLAFVYQLANSISETIKTPFLFSCSIKAVELGIPGLFTTSSALII